jgi:putative phage-type endonuclease
MKHLLLEQNSYEWLEFRRTKIGASDAPIIMGISPYKTVKQLLEEKISGQSKTFEHAGIKAGKDLEPYALAIVNDRLQSNLKPLVGQSDTYDWMIASFDGYDVEKNIAVEIKCPNLHDHLLAVRGDIPEKYKPQLQHQMLVSGLKSIIYASYRDLEVSIVEVHEDLEMQAKLLELEKEFYNSMQNGSLSENLGYVENQELDELFERLQVFRAEKKEMIKVLEDQEEKLKAQILELVNETEVKTKNTTIRKVYRTTYDYKKLTQDYGIDPTPYQKESFFWDFKQTK